MRFLKCKAWKLSEFTFSFIFTLLFVHFFSHSVVEVEDEIQDWSVNTANAMMEQTATSFGYVRPGPAPLEPEQLSNEAIVEREAMRNGINIALGKALFMEESGGNCGALSKKGALGCMQIMPFNAPVCGYTKEELKKDAEKNIICGFKLFKAELVRFGWDAYAATQSYNGGPRCVGICQESINHAVKVMRRMAQDVDIKEMRLS